MNNHMRLGFRHNPLFGHVNPVDLEKGQFGGGCFSAHAKKRASIPIWGGRQNNILDMVVSSEGMSKTSLCFPITCAHGTRRVLTRAYFNLREKEQI